MLLRNSMTQTCFTGFMPDSFAELLKHNRGNAIEAALAAAEAMQYDGVFPETLVMLVEA